jgi:hypothetical protein
MNEQEGIMYAAPLDLTPPGTQTLVTVAVAVICR